MEKHEEAHLEALKVRAAGHRKISEGHRLLGKSAVPDRLPSKQEATDRYEGHKLIAQGHEMLARAEEMDTAYLTARWEAIGKLEALFSEATGAIESVKGTIRKLDKGLDAGPYADHELSRNRIGKTRQPAVAVAAADAAVDAQDAVRSRGGCGELLGDHVCIRPAGHAEPHGDVKP